MQPRIVELALHLARIALSIFLIAVADRLGSVALALAGSALLFFGAFALMHDLGHGALRLPRAVNELMLSAAGALLLMSGHALRRMHLRHHASPLADDDIEGRPARGSLLQAIASGPRAAVELRIAAFRGAGRKGSRWQLAESAVSLASLVALVASGNLSLQAYAFVAVMARLSMSVWAAHIPHNAPAWLVRIAESLAWSGSPSVLALAYHERHHARPDLPCQRLSLSGPMR